MIVSRVVQSRVARCGAVFSSSLFTVTTVRCACRSFVREDRVFSVSCQQQIVIVLWEGGLAVQGVFGVDFAFVRFISGQIGRRCSGALLCGGHLLRREVWFDNI